MTQKLEFYRSLARELVKEVHTRDTSSKSNTLYFMRERVIDSVTNYAHKNEYDESEFVKSLENSISILDGIYDSFEPYRNSTGDSGDIWEHQRINTNKYLESKDGDMCFVSSANGLLDDYVSMYLDTVEMHNQDLTCLLLDAYFFNDTISTLYGVKNDRNRLNIIRPAKSTVIIKTLMKAGLYLGFITMCAFLYSFDKELLTPFIIVFLYFRYKSFELRKEKVEALKLYNKVIEKYTFSTGDYNYEQISAEIRHLYERYGIRYSNRIYGLVSILKK